MNQSFRQLGITITEAEARDVLDITYVHAKTYVETYHTEGKQVKPKHYFSREAIERFVYQTDFVEALYIMSEYQRRYIGAAFLNEFLASL